VRGAVGAEEAQGRTQGVAEQVAQSGVAQALAEAIALPKSFDVNDDLAHSHEVHLKL
jgi:hypothetical protein